MIKALEMAVNQREDAWGTDREIAALNVEVLHSFLLAYLRVNGAKNVGKPIHFERPWEKARKRESMLSPREFAFMTGAARG